MSRQHYRLAIDEIEPPANTITLLVGAEADRKRRRASQLSVKSEGEPTQWLRRSFSYAGLECTQSDQPAARAKSIVAGFESSNAARDRLQNYRRSLHAHTQQQMAKSPTTALTSYRKTMQALTMNQLGDGRDGNESECDSLVPRKAKVDLQAPGREILMADLGDDNPSASFGSPDGHHLRLSFIQARADVLGIDFRKLKRSVTDPAGVQRAASIQVSGVAGV